MKTSLQRSKGFSLVELMVTLVISMVAILSMLSLFQGLSRNSTEAKVGARLDGQVQLGLLTAHKLLQGAGYLPNSWTAPVYGTDLLLVTNASLNDEDGTVSGNPVTTLTNAVTVSTGAGWALVWRTNGTLSGLYSPSAGGLFNLTGTGTTLSWADNVWALSSSLIPTPMVQSANLQNSGQVSITLTPTSCQPAGIQLGTLSGGNVVVTLTATGYAAAASQTSTSCLINF